MNNLIIILFIIVGLAYSNNNTDEDSCYTNFMFQIETNHFFYRHPFLEKHNLIYEFPKEVQFYPGTTITLNLGFSLGEGKLKNYKDNFVLRFRTQISLDNEYTKDNMIVDKFNPVYDSLFPGTNEHLYDSMIIILIRKSLKINLFSTSVEIGFSVHTPYSKYFQVRLDMVQYISLPAITKISLNKDDFLLSININSEKAPPPIIFAGNKAYKIFEKYIPDSVDTVFRPFGLIHGIRLYLSIAIFDNIMISIGYHLPLKCYKIKSYIDENWLRPDIFDNFNIFLAFGFYSYEKNKANNKRLQ